MIITIIVPITIIRILWWATDRCTHCGGELIVYYWDKAVCKNCGKLN